MYIDTEGTFRPERIKKMDCETKNSSGIIQNFSIATTIRFECFFLQISERFGVDSDMVLENIVYMRHNILEHPRKMRFMSVLSKFLSQARAFTHEHQEKIVEVAASKMVEGMFT